MQDQHKKIKGYRDLGQQEIDLMNRIKAHGEETKELLKQVRHLRDCQYQDYCESSPNLSLSGAQIEESMRCLRLAQDNLQTGQMWFVRAVALPDSF